MVGFDVTERTRVARLERAVRTQGYAIVGLAGAVVAVLLVAATDAPPEEIQARSFVVVDEAGRRAAALVADGGGSLMLLGTEPGTMASLSASRLTMYGLPDGSADLTSRGLMAHHGGRRVSVRLDDESTQAAIMAVGSDGSIAMLQASERSASVHVVDETGKTGAGLMTDKGMCALLINDASGLPRAMLTLMPTDDTIGFRLFDREENELATMAVASTGPSLGIRRPNGDGVIFVAAKEIIGAEFSRTAVGAAAKSLVSLRLQDEGGEGLLVQDKSGRSVLVEPVH